MPPQHGAWAFLSVPVLGGFAVAGTSPAGWLLLAAWLSAYPLGYYAGRARRPGYRRASIAWHVGAAIATAVVSPWWLIGFGPALIRSVALRPGVRPGLIGGVEVIVSVLVVFAAFLTL